MRGHIETDLDWRKRCYVLGAMRGLGSCCCLKWAGVYSSHGWEFGVNAD